MTDIFISDLHLCDERPDVYRAFCRFLHNLGDDVQQLYILGDLFEIWVGEDQNHELATKVIAELRLLAQRRIRVFFQPGNRDFLIGKQFAKAANIEILPDYHLYEYADKRILLMHGDLLCTDDKAYLKYRHKVQNPLVKGVFGALPLALRKKIGGDIRSKSQKQKGQKDIGIMDVNQSAVVSTMERFQVSELIHGHTHRPAVHSFEYHSKALTRYVLGDWSTKLWWIESTAEDISLNSEPIG